MSLSRVLIAGMSGGGGKTLVSLGLVRAWRRQGLRVAPFKKGPDFIDAAWLSVAAGRPCRNLDLFLTPAPAIRHSLEQACAQADVAVVEGNRGLYDGVDASGTYSTAELAKLLDVPVLLVVDCTKATCTVAATVLGCQRLDPDVPLRGVILNRTGGRRHESVLREAVAKHCGIPVLGALPKVWGLQFPERHLGLVPPQEHGALHRAVEQAGDVAEGYLDLAAIREIAEGAPDVASNGHVSPRVGVSEHPPVRIGVFRDAAFQFYYPENLEALASEGAELVETSPLRDPEVGDVDGLYIGGGFPETLAATLSDNTGFRRSVKRLAESGLPIYAECGGAVYLGETLRFQGSQYEMAGVLPVSFGFADKPKGHGYTVLETVAENPFFQTGTEVRGHEFHYTYMEAPSPSEDLAFAFRVRRGYGFDGERDGLCRHNVLAAYTHVHALGTETWAPAVVRAAGRTRTVSRRRDAVCEGEVRG